MSTFEARVPTPNLKVLSTELLLRYQLLQIAILLRTPLSRRSIQTPGPSGERNCWSYTRRIFVQYQSHHRQATQILRAQVQSWRGHC